MRSLVVSSMRLITNALIYVGAPAATLPTYKGNQDARQINIQAGTDEAIKDLIKTDFNYAATIPIILLQVASGTSFAADYVELEADQLLTWRENLALFGFALPNILSLGYVASRVGHEKNTLAAIAAGTVGSATPQGGRYLLTFFVNRHKDEARQSLLLNGEAVRDDEALVRSRPGYVVS